MAMKHGRVTMTDDGPKELHAILLRSETISRFLVCPTNLGSLNSFDETCERFQLMFLVFVGHDAREPLSSDCSLVSILAQTKQHFLLNCGLLMALELVNECVHLSRVLEELHPVPESNLRLSLSLQVGQLSECFVFEDPGMTVRFPRREV